MQMFRIQLKNISHLSKETHSFFQFYLFSIFRFQENDKTCNLSRFKGPYFKFPELWTEGA